MRHSNASVKIGKDYKQKKAMLKNLTAQLVQHEKVVTTLLRAKAVRSYAEKIITKSRKDSLHNRRLVYKHIRNTALIKKLFEDIGKRYINRNGGYLRILKLGQRKGDGAKQCRIELVEELLESKTDTVQSDSKPE